MPARGLEPRTLGLKARPELRRTPPHASFCIRFSASRLPVAPRGTSAWQYKLAIRTAVPADELDASVDDAPGRIGCEDGRRVGNPAVPRLPARQGAEAIGVQPATPRRPWQHPWAPAVLDSPHRASSMLPRPPRLGSTNWHRFVSIALSFPLRPLAKSRTSLAGPETGKSSSRLCPNYTEPTTAAVLTSISSEWEAPSALST